MGYEIDQTEEITSAQPGQHLVFENTIHSILDRLADGLMLATIAQGSPNGENTYHRTISRYATWEKLRSEGAILLKINKNSSDA